MKLLTVNPGEEVLETLNRLAAEQNITNAAIVLIGAVDACAISNMAANDALNDIVTEYRQPFELSGTGEFKNGKAHLHIVLSKEGDAALGGHLHWAKVETFFVNAYVSPLME